jgi:calcium permeable stress-gated cation channel
LLTLYPFFVSGHAQILIDMDNEDQQSGRMEDLHNRLHSAYFQFHDSGDIPLEGVKTISRDEDGGSTSAESNSKESVHQPESDLSHPTLEGFPVSQLRNAARSLSFIVRLQKKGLSV